MTNAIATATPREDWFEAFPGDFPGDDPLIAPVWAARSLVDVISRLEIFSCRHAPADSFTRRCVVQQVQRFNRDMRELSRRLPEGFDERAANLYGVAGVRIGDWFGTCYSDVAHSMGMELMSTLVLETNPAGLMSLASGKFTPVDPSAVADAWQNSAGWFAKLHPNDTEALSVALLNEHRAMSEAQPPRAGGRDRASGTATATTPRLTANQKMLKAILDNGGLEITIGWSAAKFAEVTGCTVGAIKKCSAWTGLMAERESRKPAASSVDRGTNRSDARHNGKAVKR